MFYETLDDAQRRLVRTVVMFKEIPVYIMGINEERVDFHELISQKSNRVGISREKDFDLTPVNLGYINYGKNSLYSWRNPARRFKQGLNEETFVIHNGAPRDILTSKALGETILNIYPALDVCIQNLLDKSINEIAFHRKFCLYRSNNSIGIKYKGSSVIGHIGKDGLIRMVPNMGYLDSLLMEVVGHERYKII